MSNFSISLNTSLPWASFSSSPSSTSPAPCRLQELHGRFLGFYLNFILSKKQTEPDKPFLKLQFSHIREPKPLPCDSCFHSTHYLLCGWRGGGHLFTQGRRGHREEEHLKTTLKHFKTTTYVLLPSSLYSFITLVPSTRKAHRDKQTHTDHVFHTQSYITMATHRLACLGLGNTAQKELPVLNWG